MADEYIKREDAIEAIENTDWYHFNSQAEMVHGANSDLHQAWYSANDIYSAIENVPSADVAPVRHGHWRLVSRLDEVEWLYGVVIECSQCKHEEVKHYNYCPACGAKMDGGDTDA